MPMINLIQEQRMAARQAESAARLFFIIFLVALVGAVLGYLFLLFSTESLRSRKAALQEQIQKNAPIIEEIEKNRKAVTELSPRLQTLEDAQVVTGRWGRILDHLTINTPDGLYLTGIRTQGSDPEKAIQVSFSGVGVTQERIGELMLRLQNSPDLENVGLKFTQGRSGPGGGLEFEIGADIKGTAERRARAEGEAEGEAKS